jgi:hypothetical protein
MNCAVRDSFVGELAFVSRLKTRWQEEMSDVIVLCREALGPFVIEDSLTEEPIILPAFNDCQWTVILLHEMMHSLLWTEEGDPRCHDLSVQGFIPAGAESEGAFPYFIRRLGPFSDLPPEAQKARCFVRIFGQDHPNAAHTLEDTVLYLSCEDYLHGLTQGDMAGCLNLPIARKDRQKEWIEKAGKYIRRICWEDWACEEIKKH